MSERRHGTVQLHIRADKKVIDKLDAWLRRTGRAAHGARGAEIERMIEDGVEKRVRAEKRRAKR